ncbi:MAG: Ig-like domain-containing protein [Sphaerochaetaceae bacterium]
MEINNDMGLNIVTTYPAPYMSDVSIYSELRYEFSYDIDTKTLPDAINVYESVEGTFTSLEDLEDITKYLPVKCRTSYKDKVVELKPLIPLTPGKLYITYIPQMVIKSITGALMLLPYTGQFQTQAIAEPEQPEIVSPGIGAVLSKELQPFTWTTTGEAYNLQVSTSSTFETLILDETIDDTQFQPEPLSLAEGRYYLRVRALGGSWSELTVFFVKVVEDAPVSHEDSKPVDPVMPWEEDFEVLEVFPDEEFSGAAVNLKTAYVKVKGELKISDIELCEMVGQLSDEDDEGILVPHGLVDGTWTVVYNNEENVSYLIFVMDAL